MDGTPPPLTYSPFVLTVAPEVRALRRRLDALRGQNVTLECASEAWPRGLCYWEGPLHRRPGELRRTDGRLQIRLLPVALQYRRRMLLTVARLTGADFGRYRCACENGLGSNSDMVELRGENRRAGWN